MTGASINQTPGWYPVYGDFPLYAARNGIEGEDGCTAV